MTYKKASFCILVFPLLLALFLSGCSIFQEPAAENGEPATPENTAGQDQPAEPEQSADEFTVGNYYLAVTDHAGTAEDGFLAAAGFLGYVPPEDFAKTAEDYGYAHLSRVPIWADCGGNEAWVIVPKYNDSHISVKALREISIGDGQQFEAGEEIATAEESLVVYASSSDSAANIEIIVSCGESSITFSPRISWADGAAELPDNVWDISEYQPPVPGADPLLGQWSWEEDGVTQYLTISEGSAETGSAGAYWMVSEMLYPGADPGMGGPYGGVLTMDGNQATYSLSVSEGSLFTELTLTQEGDNLTFTWTGGDRYFGLQAIGDSLTFRRDQ